VNWTNAPNDGSLVVDLTTHEPYEEIEVITVVETDSFHVEA